MKYHETSHFILCEHPRIYYGTSHGYNIKNKKHTPSIQNMEQHITKNKIK